MTAAAFQATFTDWRLVKGRKVIQIVFEVPIEQADQAYQVLGGMPDPGSSVWCAVARLVDGAAAAPREAVSDPCDSDAPPPASHKPFREMSYAQQAGILCADKKFWRFLTENFVHFQIQSEDDAVNFVRNICLVDSRRDIIPGSHAERAWRELVDRYRVWEMVPV